MEYVFEFLLELLLEGGIEASKSSKIPKLVRYLLIAIISLFFFAIIALIIFTGVLLLRESIIGGICFILLGLFMLIMGVIKFRKTYLTKRVSESDKS